jgi:uncharacterized membrane protein YecN with MAPEG domain
VWHCFVSFLLVFGPLSAGVIWCKHVCGIQFHVGSFLFVFGPLPAGALRERAVNGILSYFVLVFSFRTVCAGVLRERAEGGCQLVAPDPLGDAALVNPRP